MSVWKSTREMRAPPGTYVSDNMQDALLWFLDRLRREGSKKRVPVILLLDLPHPSTTPLSVRAYKQANDGHVTFRTAMGWLEGVGRMLPTKEDFNMIWTERRILDVVGREVFMGVDMAKPTPYRVAATSTTTRASV